jgi:hypothetical protein
MHRRMSLINHEHTLCTLAQTREDKSRQRKEENMLVWTRMVLHDQAFLGSPRAFLAVHC